MPALDVASAPIRVGFLQAKPLINGLPKPETQVLPLIDLPHMPEDAASAPLPPVRLRLGYGAEFLYLCVEFVAERLVARDRGYQSGDGIIVTVAEPTADGSPSSRYYLLGFSHQEKPEFMWARRVLWEHDCRTTLMPLGRDVEVAGAAVEGVSRLEVSIPWPTLHPYHPWLSDGIGLDVLFINARGEHEADAYGLLPFEGGEQDPRPWLPTSFEGPVLASGHQIAVVAPGRVARGERLPARVAVCAGEETEDRVSARLVTGEGDVVTSVPFPLRAEAGLTRFPWEIDTASLAPGGYRIFWRSARGAVETEQGLTVLPVAHPQEFVAKVTTAAKLLPPPDAATLVFAAADLEDRLSALAPARTAGVERLQFDRLLEDLRECEAGRNPVASRRGVFRRAFRSRIDGTLQPFSVLVPHDYDGAPRPLCVLLHGSGVDDVYTLRSPGREVPDSFLVVAPYGRGASNFFVKDHAQVDIAEAVQSARDAYAVDAERVLVAGFSMGGYGALRTYCETPHLYRAVAVFSGVTAVPSQVPGVDPAAAPDFTTPAHAQVFAGVPMFVFHGRKDSSVPCAEAERMVECLRGAGADVTFIVGEDVGHDMPGADVFEVYARWVDEHVRK